MKLKRTRSDLKEDVPKKQKKCSVTLEDMPNEILIHIFSYLGWKSLGDCAQISKRFKDIVLNRPWYSPV